MGVGIRMGAKSHLLDPIFGNGSLGNVTLTSNQTWNASAVDTGVIERQYKNLVINSGVTISAGNRNSGIIIRCTGNCTINGSIINNLSPRTHSANLSAYYPAWLISNGRGGNGASPSGAGMTGRYYGGGYGGGGKGGNSYWYRKGYGTGNPENIGSDGGSAANITISVNNIFVGGAGGYNNLGDPGTNGGGGGGAASNEVGTSSSYRATGGNGGSGAGGAGGAGGEYNAVTHIGKGGGGGGAGNYGGGVIIIYCAGTLTINGTLNCNGRNGGNGGSSSYSNGQTGGGGGGGRIYLLSKKQIASTGTCLVNAGNGAGNGNRYYTTYNSYKHGIAPTAF